MEILTRDEVMDNNDDLNKIIVALDTDISDGINIVEQIEDNDELKDMIYGYKVGSLWILEEGLSAVEDLSLNLPDERAIILDMQKWPTDMPTIVAKQIDKVADMGCVNELIGCPMGGGIKSFETFIESCQDNCIRPLVVLEMTHPGSDSWLSDKYSMSILNVAAENGVDGYIIPATKFPKPEIKEILESKYSDICAEFYTIGYKVQGGQARPMIDYGVTKFIIGSFIYESYNIEGAIRNAFNDINSDAIE